MMVDDLVSAWKSGKAEPDEVVAFVTSPEYAALPYAERNRPFLTASKLRAYERCPYLAKLEFIDRTPPPVEAEEDYFTIGQAVDDWMTGGREFFGKRYAEVARRGTKAAEAEAQGRVQLTSSQFETITRAAGEAAIHPLFPKKWEKRVIVWLAFGKHPCKAELDHYEEGRICDLKTTANILTFKPESYRLQMAFYYSGILETQMEKPVADLCVVDKNSGWSRSHVWRYGQASLEAEQGRVNSLIQSWLASEESGVWPMPDLSTEEGRRIAFDSPYYPLLPRTNEPDCL